MMVKIAKKGTRFECDNWRGICVLPAVVKIIAKVILKYIKDHLERLIERAGWFPGPLASTASTSPAIHRFQGGFGHCHTLRRGVNCSSGYAMQWKPRSQESGRVGRSKGNWRRIVEKERRHLKKSWRI